jgi:hypothetical protein
MTCPLCHTSLEPGWLCEKHAGQPWGQARCGGAGAPCACNPAGQVLWRQVCADLGTGERETAEAIHRVLTSAPRQPVRRLGR